MLPWSVWIAGGGPISGGGGGGDFALLPKHRHGYLLGGSQLLKTSRGGRVCGGQMRHPALGVKRVPARSELGGQGGDRWPE